MLTPKTPVPQLQLSSRYQSPTQSSPERNLQITFNSLDNNNSGYINKETLLQAIIYTGDNYDKHIIAQEIEKCSSQISLQRFMEIFNMAQIEANQQVHNASLFKMYDRTGKGYIDRYDLKWVSEITGVHLSEQELNEMLEFNEIPGQAQFEEFVQIMNDQNLWF